MSQPSEQTVRGVRWHLRETLRALAADGETALATQPIFTQQADELALDYEHWCSTAMSMFGSEFTSKQRDALRAVDHRLAAFSGADYASLWTEEAVKNHPMWEEVRTFARQALTLLGWEGTPLSWAEYETVRDAGEAQLA
jgi:hypothetical protein